MLSLAPQQVLSFLSSLQGQCKPNAIKLLALQLVLRRQSRKFEWLRCSLFSQCSLRTSVLAEKRARVSMRRDFCLNCTAKVRRLSGDSPIPYVYPMKKMSIPPRRHDAHIIYLALTEQITCCCKCLDVFFSFHRRFVFAFRRPHLLPWNSTSLCRSLRGPD